MPNRTPLPQIPEPAVRLSITPIDDLAETTLVTVQQSGPVPFMQTYAVTRAGVVTPVVRDDSLGKADSGGARRFRDGTVRLFVSEADPVAGASGTTSGVTFYDQPGAFPPQAAPPASGTVDAQARADIVALKQQIAALTARLNRHILP